MTRLLGFVLLSFAVFLAGINADAVGVALAPEGPKAEPIAAPPEIDIEGLYLATGKLPDGSPYKGVVIRIRKIGKGYRFQWDVEGVPPAAGIGMRRGSDIAVSMAEMPRGMASVCRYRIEDGPKLVGTWMQPDGTAGTEELTFLAKLP